MELMGEDQRYYDIRRWKIAPQVMNQWAKGIEIKTPYGALAPNYTIINVEERLWNTKWYFLPIDVNEINKN